MSWLSQNYEKAAIGGSALVALGLAFFGWQKISKVDDEFSASLRGAGNNDASVENAGLVAKAQSSLGLDRTWERAEDAGRAVDLFVGVPLFVHRDSPQRAVDLIKDDPVHPPIPNGWWLENRLDPGFADSPHRDPDGDGFSNLEEFQAGSDPNDRNSHPSLIAKLMYIRDESLVWVLRPGFESEGGFTFKYEDSKRQTNAAGAAAVVMPDTLFFTSGPAKERFKLLGSEKRQEMNERIQTTVDITYVKVEDQKPNKKGVVYEIPAQFQEQRKMEFAKYDRTAIFSLEALGQSGTEFKVEENTTFGLPPSSAKKDYLLKEVTPDGVVVEYTDAQGARQTVEIGKGSLPAR